MAHVAIGLKELLKLNKGDEEEIMRKLEEILEHKRGQIDEMEFDPTKNTEYDAEWAKIGKDEKVSEDESDSDDKNESIQTTLGGKE